MTIIIPFEEVVQSAETDEERIRAKEAIYQGLFKKEAHYSGRTFEETLPVQKARDEQIDGKYMCRFREIASLEGISA